MLWVLSAWGVLRVHLPVADEQESLGPSLSSPVAKACSYLKSESWRVIGSLLGDWVMIGERADSCSELFIRQALESLTDRMGI